MKKISTLLSAILITAISYGQHVSDATIDAYINTNIVPNAANAITATKMNLLLNYINDSKLNQDSIQTIRISGDTVFVVNNGTEDTIVGDSSGTSAWTSDTTTNKVYVTESDWKVGIGTDTPLKELDINGCITSDASFFEYNVIQNHGMVSFVFDDGFDECYTLAKSMLTSQGIDGTFAIPVDWIDSTGFVTWAQVVSLFNDGNEIMLHPHGKYGHYVVFDTLTESEAISAITNDLDSFRLRNINITSMCYPNGVSSRLSRQVVSKYLKYARGATSTSGVYPQNFKTVGAGVGVLANTPINAERFKDSIDVAYLNNKWAVIYTHNFTSNDLDSISKLIDYAQSLGMPIVKYSEGHELAGNLISVGDNFHVNERGATLDTIWGNTTINGNLNIPKAGQFKINNNPILHEYGTSNLFVGTNAGNLTLTSNNNIGIGVSALSGSTVGNYNLAIGGSSLLKNTTGEYNVSVGALSMYQNDTGSYNIAIGSQALYGYSGYGTDNVIAIGFGASKNIIGNNNIFIGTNCGNGGDHAIAYNNVGVGYFSLGSLTIGHDNASFGKSTGIYMTEGSENSLFGIKAGGSLTTGSGNVLIGFEAGSSETTGSDKLYIANSATSTPLIYGEFNNSLLSINGSLGVGTMNPLSNMNIEGINSTGILTLSNSSASILAGDSVGQINFYTKDASGIAHRVVSVIKTIADDNYAGSIAPTSLSFLTQGDAGNAVTEKIRITGAGNVGIGTTSPDKVVEINSANGSNLRLTYNDANGTAANYTDFAISSAGDLTITPSGGGIVYGDTFWKDAMVSGLALHAGVQAPTLTQIGASTIYGLGFNHQTANDIAYGSVQFNHDMKLGTDVGAHCHWTINNSPATGSDTVVLQLEYAWADIDEAIPSSTTVTIKIPTYRASGGGYHRMTELVSGISGSGGDGLSSILFFRIERMQNSSSDTYAGWFILESVDFHYQVDSPGSEQELIK